MSAPQTHTPPRPGLPMPVTRVAEICQLTPADIYRAHTPEMGSPGHFIYPLRGTEQSYTLLGLCSLAEGMLQTGHDLEAKILRIEIARLRSLEPTPPPSPAAPVAEIGHRWDIDAEHRQDAFYGRDAA